MKPWLVVFLAAGESLSSINIGRIGVAIAVAVAEVIARMAPAAALNSVSSSSSSSKSMTIRQVGRSDMRLFGRAPQDLQNLQDCLLLSRI